MSIKNIIKPIIKFPLELMASRYGNHRRHDDESRLWIMMYHRILPQNDPRYLAEEPGMIVEPDTFQMHLKILKSEFTMISLSEWVKRKKHNQSLPLKACAVTFDDGWLDNYEYAFPILQQEQVPASLFTVSDMIGTNQTFWPNRIQSLLEQPKEKLEKISWLSELTTGAGVNKELAASVIYSLKHHSDTVLIELIDMAESALKILPNATPVLVNLEQLREMSNSGLIEVGSHTCQHIRLVEGLDDEVYHNEIFNSKKKLEEILDKPVNLFCYPNGDYCKRAITEVTKYYDAAVTTHKGINKVQSSHLYNLSRFGVHQDISSNKRTLLSNLSNWL